VRGETIDDLLSRDLGARHVAAESGAAPLRDADAPGPLARRNGGASVETGRPRPNDREEAK
jgi:hypothetical protein